jgi:hypothetical protein
MMVELCDTTVDGLVLTELRDSLKAFENDRMTIITSGQAIGVVSLTSKNEDLLYVELMIDSLRNVLDYYGV